MATDSRSSRRFNLRLPVTLLRCGGQTVEQQSETANVSSNGVLIRTSLDMEIGAAVEYIVTLTPPIGARKTVQLHCLGKVVRRDESNGVAATIDRYLFVRA